MRVFIFRGKQLGGEWIYGDLLQRQYSTKIGCYVVTPPTWQYPCGNTVYIEHEVIGDTVGQFTGLKDKNGKDIYEGDILKAFSMTIPSYEVFYERGCFRLRYKLSSGDFYDWGPLSRMEEIMQEGHFKMHPEVIGNIHDSPELLTPSQKGDVNYNMKDPNVKPAETNEQATEQESAGEATEQSAEEGGVEG